MLFSKNQSNIFPSSRSGGVAHAVVLVLGLWLGAVAIAQPVTSAAGVAVGAPGFVGAAQAEAAVLEAPMAGGSVSEMQTLELNNVDAAQEASRSAELGAKTQEQSAKFEKLSATSQNNFQRLVKQSTGQSVPVFGADLFGIGHSFGRSVSAPVSDDYVLGPGDQVVIRAWGSIDIDYKTTVDRTGQISLPRVGVFTVAGSRASDLDKALKAQLSKLYKNYSLSVSVGKLRSVRLYAVGQAKQPGVFQVSGNATFLSAVFASGGPNENGSMREILLKRNGRVVASMDMYDFLLEGKVNQDVRMMGGDVLVFQNVQKQVALLGVSNRQAIYELKDSADSIQQLVRFSGGFAVGANKKMLLLERRSDVTGKREVQRIHLPSQNHMALHAGDVVTILGAPNQFSNAVTLKGNVAAPLRYPYAPGMRVSDLIPNKEALLTPAYFEKKNRLVQYESGFEASEKQQAEDVNRYTDDVNWQHATITRLDKNLTEKLISFNLYRAVVLRDPSQDLYLQSGDVITIYNQADVAIARSQKTKMVTLSGEFSAAGIYQVEAGETLRSLIARVGGLTPNAYLYASVFSREKVKQQQQKALSTYIDRLEKEVQIQAVDQSGSVTAQNSAASRILYQKQLIDKLKNVEPNGRISMNMPYASTFADVPDIQLEDGDVFFVPAKDSAVSVFGAVYSPGSFLYASDKDMQGYLHMAGGAQRSALVDDAYVLHANGSVSVRKNWSRWQQGGQQVWPGDAIIVPDDLDRYALVRGTKDWTQIFYQFAIGVASLKVLRN